MMQVESPYRCGCIGQHSEIFGYTRQAKPEKRDRERQSSPQGDHAAEARQPSLGSEWWQGRWHKRCHLQVILATTYIIIYH